MTPSSKKLILFKGIALSIPFLFLLLVETILRCCSYGSNLDSLFLTTANNQYYYLNKDISKRYFTTGQATTGNVEFFKKNKDANTFRLFVLGESAALGFPYPNNISFQRMLKYTMQQNYPDKDIEIINLSLTAINSYTFYDFGKELHNYLPDAILIYGGHNEYYGALGVASTSNVGSTSWGIGLIIKLRQTKIVQLLENSYNKIGSLAQKEQADNLMKYVVKDQLIKYNNEVYKKGIVQFENNLTSLLSLFHKQNIPVFIATVATNLKDQYPFQSYFSEGTDSAYYCNRLAMATTCFNENKTAEAEAIVGELYNQDSVYAKCSYLYGQICYNKGEYEKAYTLFKEAQRYDCLRFRAPEEINNVIRKQAASYPNTSLVDVETHFRQISKHGITGGSLLLEHVHPTICGHREIARSFYQQMEASGLIKKQSQFTIDSVFYSFPVLDFDSLSGEYACAKLRKGFPFYEKGNVITANTDLEQLALNYTTEKNWFESMKQLYQYAVSAKNYPMALDILRVRIIDNGYDASFYPLAGELCTIMNRYNEALAYYKKAFRLTPSFSLCREIITTALRNDNPEEAFLYVDYAIVNNTSSMDFRQLKAYLQDIIRLKKEFLVADPTQKKTLCLAIASAYSSIGNKDVSDTYYRQALILK